MKSLCDSCPMECLPVTAARFGDTLFEPPRRKHYDPPAFINTQKEPGLSAGRQIHPFMQELLNSQGFKNE